MRLNPFRESNFNDLQQNLNYLLSERKDSVKKRFSDWLAAVRKKGNERITLMFIPHSEKKIVNFHISMYTVTIVLSLFAVIIVVTSLTILNHTSTVKEVDKLELYESDYANQIEMYKEEINRLYSVFKKFDDQADPLFRFTPEGASFSSGKGGGSEQPPSDPSSPSIESLTIEEIEQEFKASKDKLLVIKRFMESRAKVIENTPSLWPVNGNIITAFGDSKSSSLSGSGERALGVDIAAYPGSEIKVSAPGTVESIVWDSVYGLRITVSHKYGYSTIYSYCQRVTVDVGQKLSKGEIIGYVGKTGRAARYMLHYQIRIGTNYADPLPYLNKISLDSKI